jgi:hypothetical protein
MTSFERNCGWDWSGAQIRFEPINCDRLLAAFDL